MRSSLATVVLALVSFVAIEPAAAQPAASAVMTTAAGTSAGSVTLVTAGDKVRVRADLTRLPPGFHGFHVHAVGSCVAPTFASAGGHLNPGGAAHPSHAGDMPLVHVNADGTASIELTTDRFRILDLFDADGSAIIVHANPDNYANIPRDRYDPDPDATTLATGDAGGRLACGVIAPTSPPTTRAEAAPAALAEMRLPEGSAAGFVAVREEIGKVRVSAELRGLAPGFHGFHVHAVGACEGPTFMSAGGHLNPAGATHPSHAGDMPVAYVNADGTVSISFVVDRFRVADLFDADGSALVVHANPDNYANIPRDRYDPDPDGTTLSTGDAGARAACGVVRRLARCTIALSRQRVPTGTRTSLRATVRSSGQPVAGARVHFEGPGISRARLTTPGGVAAVAVTARRRGRLNVFVEPLATPTLGCRTSIRIVRRATPAARPGIRLTGAR